MRKPIRLANLVFSLVPLLAACSSDFAKSEAPPEAPGAAREAIAGGSDDIGTAESDVVVLLGGPTGGCTGTLVTPLLVLTAKHCIRGDDSGKVGLGFPVNVYVGSRLGKWSHTYKVSTPPQAKTWGDDPNPTAHKGNDLGVLMLDSPAFEVPNIQHPSLTPPSDDATLGMAGWAPADTNDYRKVAYQQGYVHDQGNPDFGQFWLHDQGSIHDDPGDSGGPLFLRRFVTTDKARGEGYWYRDVVGVLHGWEKVGCWEGTCDHDTWTDITRGAPRDWVLGAVRDPIARGANWLAMHPTYGGWYGDVDYTGPCQSGPDPDCDHWYNWHDNCPNLANWEQYDTNDDGVGDACPAQPPPPPGHSSLKWSHVSIPAGGNSSYIFPPSALVVGGMGSLNEYVCRVVTNGVTRLGRFDTSSTCVLPATNGSSTAAPVLDFDVLVYDGDQPYDRPTWVPSTDSVVATDAYTPGKDASGDAIHVCRAWSGTSQFPGMLTAKGCWIAVNGALTQASTYEALLLTPLQPAAGTGLTVTMWGSTSVVQGHGASILFSSSGAPGTLAFTASNMPTGLSVIYGSFGQPVHVGDTSVPIAFWATASTPMGTFPVTITATANGIASSQVVLVEVDACTLVTTCGGQCGSIPNGCGGTLDCGACQVCTTPKCKCEDAGGTWTNGKCDTCSTPAECCEQGGGTWHNGRCI